MRDLTPQDWRMVGDVVRAHENHPEKADPVLDHFLAAAFRGEIPWAKEMDGHPAPWGKAGRLRNSSMSRFLRQMALVASTAPELRQLFRAMDYAWANGMASATGAAGSILLERAVENPQYLPPPANWKAVCDSEVAMNSGRSGAYWAYHMHHAAQLRGPQPGGREVA